MSRIVFRIIGVFVLIALLATAGIFIYRVGVADGISQATQVAEAIESGNGSPMMYGYPYHHRGFGHPFGFGLFHIFGFFIFLFFFFGLMRFLFFRGWAHKHGHWGKWEGGAPPMFDEWHKKAHGEESKPVDK